MIREWGRWMVYTILGGCGGALMGAAYALTTSNKGDK